MSDLIDRQAAIEKYETLGESDKYIVLKGKAALIAKILLDISGKDDNSE